MKSNKLVLNSKKTKYMLFHKHNIVVPTLELKINDSSIDQVSSFNFLGLHINSQLTWQTHIDEISKKMYRVIGLIYKLQYILHQKILLSLYNTLILPQINYCILLWGKEVNPYYYYKNVQFVLFLLPGLEHILNLYSKFTMC